jgi:hypothetical protein
VLAPLDQMNKPGDITAVSTQSPGHDLPVKDLSRDVGIVGGRLTPTYGSILCRHTHEADELIVEGLKSNNASHQVPSVSSANWQPPEGHAPGFPAQTTKDRPLALWELGKKTRTELNSGEMTPPDWPGPPAPEQEGTS